LYSPLLFPFSAHARVTYEHMPAGLDLTLIELELQLVPFYDADRGCSGARNYNLHMPRTTEPHKGFIQASTSYKYRIRKAACSK
jgi:hypothetical protein